MKETDRKHEEFIKSLKHSTAGCKEPCGLEPVGCRMCPDRTEISEFETCLDLENPPLNNFGRCTRDCNECPAALRRWK
jgi:hypothetical protein